MLSPLSLQTNIAAFLAPWPRLCVSQHGTFCLTPGGNTGANYRGQPPVVTSGHHPHPMWGHAVCRHPSLPSPRALSCLSSLSTHSQHHHQHGPGVRNIRGSVSQTSGHVTHCHTRGAWDRGQARGVTLEPRTKTMAAWCRECELCSQMIAAAPSSHLWQSGPLSHGPGAGAGVTRSENRNAAETDISINILLNSNQRINYKQIPLFSLCQQIVWCAIKSLYHLLLNPTLTIARVQMCPSCWTIESKFRFYRSVKFAQSAVYVLSFCVALTS